MYGATFCCYDVLILSRRIRQSTVRPRAVRHCATPGVKAATRDS